MKIWNLWLRSRMVKRRLNEWREPPNLRAEPTRFPDAWETGFYARTTFFQIFSWNWFIHTCTIYQNNEKNMTDLIVYVKIGLDAVLKLMFATHSPRSDTIGWMGCDGLWFMLFPMCWAPLLKVSHYYWTTLGCCNNNVMIRGREAEILEYSQTYYKF
jgi:hypothetical protein